MSNVIWKDFKLGDLFERSTKLAMCANQKDLNLVETFDEEHTIALISASRNGSGRVGYIEDYLVDKDKISINKLTFDDQWGFTYFQKERFVITGGHNAILEIKNNKLRDLLDNNLYCYSFLSLIINKITIKSEIFGYGYKINNKLDREIILLPCIEVSKDEEYIWEENGKYYTLAVEHIKGLMEQAKEYREQKTIRLYEAEKAKYEAEKAKYEAGYLRDKENIVWKGFTLGELFTFDSSNQLSLNKKFLDVSDVRTPEYPIALITQSEKNNGVSGYVAENEETSAKKMKNYLTYSMHFGLCFYHNYDFVLMDTHGSVFRVIPKEPNLQKIFNNSDEVNYFFGRSIQHICRNGIYNYSWLPNSGRVAREIILLPCLEVSKDEEYLWEENGKYYTLAVEYISYIYLQGRANYNQKLIDNYTYQY